MPRPEVNFRSNPGVERMVANVSQKNEPEVVAQQRFKMRERPGSERLVGWVEPTVVYEAPKPRRRRSVQ